jgi:hypothetical protein
MRAAFVTLVELAGAKNGGGAVEEVAAQAAVAMDARGAAKPERGAIRSAQARSSRVVLCFIRSPFEREP